MINVSACNINFFLLISIAITKPFTVHGLQPHKTGF